MEYYMPPPPPPPDPGAGQWRQYQYAAGFPVPPPPLNPPPAAFESTNASVDHYANFNEGEDHDIPNFDDDDDDNDDVNPSSSPIIPMETREVLLHTHPSVSMLAPMKIGTVYKKAPGAPKRFRSSYVHFFTNFLERKKQELLDSDGVPPKIDISSVSKDCSKEWKALPSNERKYWDSVSEREKEEYNKQRDAYQGPWRIATNKVKKKKEGAPKRSPSAFFLFVNAKRPVLKEECSAMPNTKVVKTCSKMWKELSETEKDPFQEEEKKLRAQYHIEAEQWKAREKKAKEEEKTVRKEKADDNEIMPPEPKHLTTANVCVNPLGFIPPIVTSAAATAPSHSRKRKRDPRAPKRSPPAFFLFVNHCRPELKMQNPELCHTDLVKMLGRKWSEMSDEDKKPFREHEEKLRQQYFIDMKHYKKVAVPEQDYCNIPNAMKAPPPILQASNERTHCQQKQPPPREEDFNYQQAMSYFE